jgi:hypothetical protein
MLGGIAVLVPRFSRLKEWAYAGIFLMSRAPQSRTPPRVTGAAGA